MQFHHLHSEIQAGILKYLSIHPDAADTIAGINAHWLQNERCSHSIDQVKTAVETLVEQDELKRRPGTNIFGL